MKSGSWRKYSVVVLKKSQMIERQIWQICPGEIPHCFVRGWELRRKPEWAKFLWGSKSEIQGKLLFSFSGIDVNGSKRLSPTPSVSNLSLRPCRYLSTVTRSSNQGSVDGFRRERLQRLATFDSLSVQRRLQAKSRMESRTIVCYLGGIWRRLEPLERIYGRFPSVDPLGRFAGFPNLRTPLHREKTVYSTTHKTAINRSMDLTRET